jgi:cytochrome c
MATFRHRVARATAALAFAGPLVAAGIVPSAAYAGPDIAFGEYLSNECVTCHQRSGNFSGIPSITGWPQETFVSALNAYRWRERNNPIMQTIADQLSDEDMAALAAYFESLGPPQMSVEPENSRETAKN